MQIPPPPPLCADDVEMIAWLRERDSNAFPAVPPPDAATLAAWRETAIAWGFIPPESRAVVPAGRDARGRFATGNSGRPRGARNKLTVEVENMLLDLAPDAVKLVSEHIRHDVRVAIWVLQNFVKPSGRHVELANLPEVKNATDIPMAVAAILAEIGSGEMSLEDGSVMIGLLDRMLELLGTAHRMRGSILPPPP
jgi:hypothetical protein